MREVVFVDDFVFHALQLVRLQLDAEVHHRGLDVFDLFPQVVVDRVVVFVRARGPAGIRGRGRDGLLQIGLYLGEPVLGEHFAIWRGTF